MKEPSLIDHAGEAASDKADWIDQEADDLFYRIDRHQAFEILENVLFDGEQAYVDFIHAVSHWVTCDAVAKTRATNELADTLQAVMRPALVKMAEEKWGDS